MNEKLHTLIEKLLEWQTDPDWWPGSSVFEIASSAILTQNTNWNNVEKAMHNLRDSGIDSWEKLLYDEDLEKHIRPAGFYQNKSRALRALAGLFLSTPEPTRTQLLNLRGVGPETADSILLYALDKPEMVIDAYTRRILEKCNIITKKCSYDELKTMILGELPAHYDVNTLKRLHAAFVEIGKRYCKKTTKCNCCPLEAIKERGTS